MDIKRVIYAGVSTCLLAAFALFSFAGAARAAGESASVGIKLDPRGTTFFKQAFRPANLSVETAINTQAATVLPMKTANLTFPGGGTMNFNPGSMPVCPDNKIGPPPTNVSIEAPQAVAACPKAIIGNGLAEFALAQSTALPRDGVIILFNGGRQANGPLKGQPRVKLYAYSYDTGVGLYAEAALARDGSLDFQIPQLTADSSVTSINLNIPGTPTNVFVASQNRNVTLPAGKKPNYVRAKCSGSGFAFSGEFLLGTRDTLGNPTSPTTTLNASNSYACSGAFGRPNLRTQNVKGPKRLKRGQTKVYRVRVVNRGTRVAKGVKIGVRGKWVKARNQRVGKIAAGRAKTFRVRAGLNGKARRGKSTVIKFRTNAKQTKATVGKTRVRVR